MEFGALERERSPLDRPERKMTMNHSKLLSRAAIIGLSVGLLLPLAHLEAQTAQPPYREDQILVKPRLAVELGALHRQERTEVIKSFPRIGGLQVVRLPAGLSVEEATRRFEASGLVWYAVPDRTDYHLAQTMPNDPLIRICFSGAAMYLTLRG